MRAAFGLVGILVVLGVIIWIMASPGGTLDHTKQVLDSGRKADAQVRTIAGIAPSGLKVSDTLTLEPQIEGGKLANVLVTKLDPGSPMEVRYGLKKFDTIIQVNGIGVKDIANGDGDLARDLIIEAYQKSQTITVIRDGKNIVLPEPNQPAPAANTAAPANSGNSGTGGKSSRDPIQGQLDVIQGTRMP